VVTRQERINDFDHEGTPPVDQPLQVLCEDHVGTYSFRFFADGATARGKAWPRTDA
jgi:hypothetical protein